MKKNIYLIYLGLVLLVFMNPLHGRDPFTDAYTDALLNAISGQNGGTDYSTMRLLSPSGSSSELKGMGETVSFKNDSAWKVKSYKIIGSILPAADFMEAVSINGLFLVVTYVVRNDSQSTESILVSPQISDEQGNHYEAYNMEAMYIKRVMYGTSKTIGLEQLNPQINYTFSAIYQIPDAKRVLMFNARELGSIVPDTKAIYLVDKNAPQHAALATTKADEDPSRTAAEQGNASAQNNLGLKYYNGEGVPKDDVEAVKWYRKAAEQGNAWGQNNLGSMYGLGLGVPQDNAQAVKWFRKAAEQGNAEGQNNLGKMYGRGMGVPQDDVEAVKWFRKAAEQGHAEGKGNLSFMYSNSRGVPK